MTNCTFQNNWLLKTISLLISCHVNISFIIENKENNKILFPDMKYHPQEGTIYDNCLSKNYF